MVFTGTLAADYRADWADHSKSCVQPKYDGVRVQLVPTRYVGNKTDVRLGRAVLTQTCTRSGKYVPNDYIRRLLDGLPVGLDGELVAADSGTSGEAQFATSMSAISAKAGEPDFKYVVYDYSGEEGCALNDMGYERRMELAFSDCKEHFGGLEAMPAWLHFAPTYETIESQEDLDAKVAELVALGYEGAIVRRLDLPHVTGRSKRKTPAVLRIKAWADCEAEIIAVVEETYHDCARNRKECPELIGTGKCFASSFECRGLPGTRFEGATFRAPLAVQDAVAKEYFERSDELIGKICKVKYLGQGSVDKPRLPGCLGLREAFDIGA